MQNNFQVLAFTENSWTPYSVKRLSDNEVFNLGEYVTNGTQMKGHIEKFDIITNDMNQPDTVFVITSWSGIGMDLDSLVKIPLTNTKYSLRQVVRFKLGWESPVYSATIIGIHLYENRVKYDLEVRITTEDGSEDKTRCYNIEENLLLAF